ncbi:MAG: MaoC family dehydratase N-terminal domain-containing protein [Proteobacteria bacterium]|nr:MaoC family dehydratase N-terminal domain-containing protein [Pseudomonadota bacterium]
MSIDLPHLKSWIGREEVRVETLSSVPSNALAATLDREEDFYKEGDALPPLWHWLHFLPMAPMREVGPDGHPKRGGFLPPVPLERRMWAGSRLAFHKPLRIGEKIEKRSRILSVDHKSGRSGDLVFVCVEHVYSSGGSEAIHEEHDIVYRAAPAPGTPQPKGEPAPTDGQFTRAITPDPVLLFRYSALTFNSHRIHYDHPYVTEVEGYPGLIVHGPLIATLLLDNLRRAHPARAVKHFSFRALSPIFHIDPFTCCGDLDASGEATLWARKADGTLAMQASATLG